MELVLMFVGEESRSIYKNQLFSFSEKFAICYDNNAISLETNNRYINVFKRYSCISNVTAVVGDNGAGKTTLLKYIIDFISNEAEDFWEFENTFIGMYEKDSNEIIIYYRGECPKIYSNTVNIKFFKITKDTFSHLKNYNLIFLSNSTDIEIRDSKNIFINLNARGFIEETQHYFNRIIDKLQPCRDFRQFCEGALRSNYHMTLQDGLYIKYFNDILKMNRKFCGKKYAEAQIAFFSFENYTDKEYDIIEQKIKNLSLNYLYPKGCVITDRLLRNVLFELSLLRRVEHEKLFSIAEGSADIFCCLKSLKLFLNRNMRKEIMNQNLYSYFCSALTFIQHVHQEIINGIDRYHIDASNRFGEDDILYFPIKKIYHLIFTSNDGICLFAIKYMKVLNFNFSSGEKALLNFFAWINSIRFMYPYLKFEGENNYLILIDEIDLYAHPLWQQQLMRMLLNQLNEEYRSKKIQLIFTTHSPLLLSDIPKSNTIYIRKSEEGSVCLDRANRKETFGANIYDLLNDAFYLSNNFIGDLAQKEIYDIVEEIKNNKNSKALRARIDLIGEPIQKYQLLKYLEMMNKKND